MYTSQRNLAKFEASQEKRASEELSPKQERKLLEQSELTKANTISSI
jgi:hypothetical protein